MYDPLKSVTDVKSHSLSAHSLLSSSTRRSNFLTTLLSNLKI